MSRIKGIEVTSTHINLDLGLVYRNQGYNAFLSWEDYVHMVICVLRYDGICYVENTRHIGDNDVVISLTRPEKLSFITLSKIREALYLSPALIDAYLTTKEGFQ